MFKSPNSITRPAQAPRPQKPMSPGPAKRVAPLHVKDQSHVTKPAPRVQVKPSPAVSKAAKPAKVERKPAVKPAPVRQGSR